MIRSSPKNQEGINKELLHRISLTHKRHFWEHLMPGWEITIDFCRNSKLYVWPEATLEHAGHHGKGKLGVRLGSGHRRATVPACRGFTWLNLQGLKDLEQRNDQLVSIKDQCGINEVLNGGENRPKAARSLALEQLVSVTGMWDRGPAEMCHLSELGAFSGWPDVQHRKHLKKGQPLISQMTWENESTFYRETSKDIMVQHWWWCYLIK